MKFFYKFLFVSLFINVAKAQDSLNTQNGGKFREQYQLHILPTKTAIKIDGDLTDPAWSKAEIATNFWELFPNDKKKYQKKTVVRTAYDEKYIYVSAECFDTKPYIIYTLKRDSPETFDSDAFALVLDPIGERSNGFIFGVNPYNVQSEDLLSANSFNDLNFSWDNKWFSATKILEDRWIVEIAIPFKTLRFNDNNKNWGINFGRIDAKLNTVNMWTNVPVQFDGHDLGYTGQLVWDKAPPKNGTNLAIIPYLTGTTFNDKEEPQNSENKLNAGLDAKIALNSSLNLDLTVNPDFSQIEVDRQVTNLTRFNIFFPERRTFFLENADIFSEYGSPPFRPFYSRTIGLDANGNKVPIGYGARVSGNITKSTRIGLMHIKTNKTDSSNYSQHYTAFTFNQKVLARSIIKGYVLNRTGDLNTQQKNENPMGQYGRNAGLELNYVSASGDVNLWGGYHISQKPNITSDNRFYQFGGGYFGKNLSAFIDYADFGTNYYADMGFINRIENYTIKGPKYENGDAIVRLGFKQMYSELEYSIRPSNSKVNVHNFTLETFRVWNPNGSFNEGSQALRYGIFFKNTSGFRFKIEKQSVNLLYYTALPDDKPLEPGQYQFWQGTLRYSSDSRKKLTIESRLTVGGFYNGTLQQCVTGISYRKQPWGNFAVNFEQNILRFPAGYGDNKLFLISPRIEINFSNSMFWTTFMQYNTQRNNYNINSRFQWRYSPMSDFFLVYTDNYFTDPFFKNKNRALVFKLSYWLSA